MYLHENFIQNKYTKWYFNIIENAKLRNTKHRDDELHHILPKSIFPEYKKLSQHKWNGVYLTPREHFICHWMLTNMTSSTNKAKMVYALNKMLLVENQYQTRYKPSSRIYKLLRESYKRNIRKYGLRGEDHPLYGRKAPWAAANLPKDVSGAKNGMFGKTHSQEAREKIAKARKGNPTRVGFTLSEETKRKLSATKIAKSKREGPRKWYNNGLEEMLLTKDDSIPGDFIPGRLKGAKWGHQKKSVDF